MSLRKPLISAVYPGRAPLAINSGMAPAAQTPPPSFCSNCGRSGTGQKLLSCTRCGKASYCNKECQLANWSDHKAGCKASAAATKEAAASKEGVASKLIEGGQCIICLDIDPMHPSSVHTLPCSHAYHRQCVEALEMFGLSSICPLCRPVLAEGPEQVFEVAVRRLTVLERRAARGDTAWDALAAQEEAEVAEVHRLLGEAAGAGCAPATTVLGFLTHSGHGVKKNGAEARRLWEDAAGRGHAAAQFNLGTAAMPSDPEAGFRWTEKAAEQGHAEAMANLGLMLQFGEGCAAPDLEHGVSWTRRAAEAGSGAAMVHLAGLLAEGRGVAQSSAEAAVWLRKAAERGDPAAAARLGLLHEEGRGVAQSDEVAVRWYTAAADGGDVDGQFKLGCMFIQNRGLAAARMEGEGLGAAELMAAAGDQQRTIHALACWMMAGSQGHEVAQSLVAELRPTLPGVDRVDLPAFARGSDPAALAQALALAAAEAAKADAASLKPKKGKGKGKKR